MRSDNTCSLQPTTENPESPLVSLVQRDARFFLSPPDSSCDQVLWLSLRRDKRGLLLSEGQVIRLGRVTVKVKHVNLAGGPSPELLPKSVEMPARAEPQPCKICLADENSSQNPLISPCKCTGSMQYVHLACLKEWLQQKISIRHASKVSSYFWRDIACELCKTPFPSSIDCRGRRYDIIAVTYPSKPYVVLEDTREDQPNGVHILSLNHGEALTVGRANDVELKLNDITVSRTHALVRNIDNQFYLVDSGSKFGTLLQTTDWISLTSAAEVVVQVSRTLLTFRLKRPCRLLSCCNSKSVARHVVENRPCRIASSQLASQASRQIMPEEVE